MSDPTKNDKAQKVLEFSGMIHARSCEAAQTYGFQPLDMPNVFAACAIISLVGMLKSNPEQADEIEKVASRFVTSLVTSLRLNEIQCFGVVVPALTEEERKSVSMVTPDGGGYNG